MEGLRQLVGRERALAEVAQALYFGTRALRPPTVGALHVTCSDESETECVAAFQSGYVQYLLPTLKFARRSAFRVANLGGRYEWGAARLAESHFAAPGSSGKVLLIKINAHVAHQELPPAVGVDSRTAPRFRLGSWRRYDRDSACCGALGMLVDGVRQPYIDELREDFHSEGRPRLAALRDPSRVDPLYVPLFAAIVSARLQARKALLDVQDYAPESPTFFAVVPCVTINRKERDTEIVCGVYSLDGRQGGSQVLYYGLGDDPEAYSVTIEHNRFSVADEQLGQERKGRDHREMMREAMRLRAADSRLHVHDERLERVRSDVARNKHRHHDHARALLRIALPVLAEVAPVPAAILAFADGVAGIHHAFRVHRIAREMEGSDDARKILDEIEARIDEMEGDRAEALLELLMREYR